VIDLGSVIAVGTSDDLKDRIGGEVLELQVVAPADAARAVAALEGAGAGAPHVDDETGVIRLPVGDAGPAVTLESTRRLDELKIPLAGFALHRPTLDDVFLSLTGHATEGSSGSEPAANGRRGRRKGRES
jgi:ABC-2 type transport system ATP-binding protein